MAHSGSFLCDAFVVNPRSGSGLPPNVIASMPTLDVVIVGATGYSGAELARILLAHPAARIVGLFGSSRRAAEPDRPFHHVFPAFRGLLELPVRPADLEAIAALRPAAVFLATPHEASMALAPPLLSHGVRVLDLSGAFRLPDPALYPRHYGFEHACPEWLGRAAYGLVECHRAAIATAELIAVPGCYPTSIILPLRPLVDRGLLAPGAPVIADAISGVSGAGRTPELKAMYCEVSAGAYGVFSHRHQPEISRHAGVETIFTPHLAPFDRGIVSTIHVELAPEVDEPRVAGALAEAYGSEPFIRLLERGAWPSVGAVSRTNFCDIAVAVRGRRAILGGAIDNLVKGAAGQAVQCFNARFGLAETAGLRPNGGVR